MHNAKESLQRERDVLPETIRPTLPEGRLEVRSEKDLTETEFFELCRQNEHLQLEREADGTIIIVTPAGSYSSNQSGEIFAQLRNWVRETGRGAAFDASGGFRLPNGATRAPDAAWVSADRLASLSDEDKKRFLPLAPDFAVEVRSENDRREDVKAKLEEYLENGTRLGWLVDPQEETVTVYRKDGTTETLDRPETVSGDPVLPEFTCEFDHVWNPGY